MSEEEERQFLLRELGLLHDVLSRAAEQEVAHDQQRTRSRGGSHRGRGGRARHLTHQHAVQRVPTHSDSHLSKRQFSWNRTQSTSAVLHQQPSSSSHVRTVAPPVSSPSKQAVNKPQNRRVVKPPTTCASVVPQKKREVVIKQQSSATSGSSNKFSPHSPQCDQHQSKPKRRVLQLKTASKTPDANKYTWHKANLKRRVLQPSSTPSAPLRCLSSSISSPLMSSTPIILPRKPRFSSPKLSPLVLPQRILKSKHKIVNKASRQVSSSKYKVVRNAALQHKAPPVVYKQNSRYRLVKKAVNTQHMLTARRNSTSSMLRRRSGPYWSSSSHVSLKQQKRSPYKSKFKVDRRKTFFSPSTNRRTVLLRGSKFSIQKSGRSLRRISISSPASRPRSVALEMASHALNKSIRTVVHKAKKRSLNYCIYFNRFGRCFRGASCPNKHDPQRVALCTRFLRGTCRVSACPFSHDVAPEKMPTCQHFLRGACSRDNCPYLHVKVSEKAEVCPAFANGFCPLADQCKKKHVIAHRKARNIFRAPAAKLRKTEEKTLTPSKSCVPTDEPDDPRLPLAQRNLPSFIALDASSDITEEPHAANKKDEVQLIRPRLSFNS